jgi:hypothetical protein
MVPAGSCETAITVILYFSILLHCIVQRVLQVMLPSACSFIALSLSYTTCFGLHGHLQVCSIFLFSCAWRSLFRWFLPFFLTWSHSARFHLWGGFNMRYKYYYLRNFWYCYTYICFLLTCVFLCCFSSLILLLFIACMFVWFLFPLLFVCSVLPSVV